MSDFKTPERFAWLRRIYGDSISPREVILTVAVVVLVLVVFSA